MPELGTTNGNRLLDGRTPSATLHLSMSPEVVDGMSVVDTVSAVLIVAANSLVPAVIDVVFTAGLVISVMGLADTDTAVEFAILAAEVEAVGMAAIVEVPIVVVVPDVFMELGNVSREVKVLGVAVVVGAVESAVSAAEAELADVPIVVESAVLAAAVGPAVVINAVRVTVVVTGVKLVVAA